MDVFFFCRSFKSESFLKMLDYTASHTPYSMLMRVCGRHLLYVTTRVIADAA